MIKALFFFFCHFLNISQSAYTNECIHDCIELSRGKYCVNANNYKDGVCCSDNLFPSENQDSTEALVYDSKSALCASPSPSSAICSDGF